MKQKQPQSIKRIKDKKGGFRFFENGERISNKNNKASLKFIRQEFNKLASSPTFKEQAELTDFEKRVFRNTQNARKGRDKISEKSKQSAEQRFRIKGKLVNKDVQNTLNFNSALTARFPNKSLSQFEEFADARNSADVLDILANEIVNQTTNKIAVLIESDAKFRPEGTFKTPIEIVNLLDEINRLKPKTEPPSRLKVIQPSGIELTDKDAYMYLQNFMTNLVEDFRQRNSVFAFFQLEYRYVSPFLIVDLKDFDEENENFFEIFESTMPQPISA